MKKAMNVVEIKGNAKRKGDWMQTLSGGEFYPIDPRPEEIRIIDIAGALSKQCRYAGHCLRFYSVAEHSVLMAQVAPDAHKLTTLLHDASEAYLCDIPRPVKPNIVNYNLIEQRLMTAICAKYGAAWPLPGVVKDLDNRILVDECIQNMAPPPRSWGLEGLEPLGVKLQFWSHREASDRFLEAFVEYGGKCLT